MPALDTPPTLRAVADLDVEAAHQRAHRGKVFLICDAAPVTVTAPPQSGQVAGAGAAKVSSTRAGHGRRPCRP